MSHIDVVRAWKSERYRMSLSDVELAGMPAHPAGLTDLTDEDLGDVAGGSATVTCGCTAGAICTSVIVSCVWTCDCTDNCRTCIFPCIPFETQVAA
jgi:mersacidin/lichenicidin family type 2 lantibiotic